MGKKRTHAETKDGFAKPGDKSRVSANKDQKKPHSHSQLVCARLRTIRLESPC
jgi:ribosome biogenesis protein MAK21